MAKILTVKAIESAKPKDREYKLTVDRGLYIRIASSGIKTWLVRYVIDGYQKQFRLPEPYNSGGGEGFLSISEARAINAEVQALAKKGIDYQLNLLEIRQHASEAKQLKEDLQLTLNNLFTIWTRDGVSRADKNKYILQSFRKHVLPAIGEIQLCHLSEHHLRNLYRSVIADGKIATAVELSKDIKQMLRWAEKRKPWRSLLIEGNPAELVEVSNLVPKGYTKERKRLLSIEELRNLKYIFETTTQIYAMAPQKYGTERPLKKEVQIAMWICLSTICRIGELLMTEWKHIDFDSRTWFIPAENTKGENGQKRDQVVYLSNFAFDQFKQLHKLTGDSEWAFPARYKEGHVCIKSASKQIGDRQMKFKSRTRKLKCRVENNCLVLGEQEWTPHDLRRTGATMMQKLKISREIINLCQNHVIGSKVDRVYLLNDYADDKKEAWNKLGDFISSILIGQNVYPIKITG